MVDAVMGKAPKLQEICVLNLTNKYHKSKKQKIRYKNNFLYHEKL